MLPELPTLPLCYDRAGQDPRGITSRRSSADAHPSYRPLLPGARLLPKHSLVAGTGYECLDGTFARGLIGSVRKPLATLEDVVNVLVELWIAVHTEAVVVWMCVLDGGEVARDVLHGIDVQTR